LTRFDLYADGKEHLDRDRFKHMMGFLDSSSSILILNRVFDSIAERLEGISLMEFVTYLDALLNGNQEDKIVLCFKMIDTKKKGYLRRDDFTSLISGAMIANTEHGARPAIEHKAELAAAVIYQKLDKAPDDTVSLIEFQATLQKDPGLLDIFTLLSKGVTESLISGSEEETRLKWYLNQAKFIVVCVKAIIREIDHPTVLLGQKAFATPGKGSKVPLHTTSQLEEKIPKRHFQSELGQKQFKPPASDHRIVIRVKSPDRKSESKSSAQKLGNVIKSHEVEDKINGLVRTDNVENNVFLEEEGSNRQSRLLEVEQEDEKEIKIDDATTDIKKSPLMLRKPPLLKPIEVPKEINGFSKRESSSQMITPGFNTIRPKDAQDFSFMNFPSRERMASSHQNNDDNWMPEIPEEGSILTVKKDQVVDIMQDRHKSFARLKEVLSNISSKFSEHRPDPIVEPIIPNLKMVKFGQSQDFVRNGVHSDEETTPIVKQRTHNPESPTHSGPAKMPRFKALKTEGLNDTISSYNEGLLMTERGPVFQLRKKMEEILRFSEDIVTKLSEEMAEKEIERQGVLQKKKLLKATRNIPSSEEPTEGPVVFVFHKRWDLVINIMIGINKATRALWDIEEHTLSKADYKMRDKYELSFKRSITENLNSRDTVSFYSFAPYVFAEIRKLYKIDSDSFLSSIGADSLINNLIRGEVKAYRELFSTGKSGSFFFYSVDGKYVVKTLRADEYSFLKSILMNYHKHLLSNPNTFIPKFFGMHELIYNKRGWKGCGCRPSQHLYLVIMDNIFVTDKTIQRRFDLKGSTYNRTVGLEKLADTYSKKIALKDLDFMKLGVQVKIDKPTRDRVLEQIDQDCRFLVRSCIIDYSLLIGIHTLADNESPAKKVLPDESNSYFVSIPSEDGRSIYYFGIIDILTSFSTCKKKSEFCIKRLFLGSGISCVPPQPYSTRFIEFMTASVFL
jgi:hypothetical protein